LKLVTLNNPVYPFRLKEIHAPPPVLWVAGDFQPEDDLAVAVVGSRAATEYGLKTSGRLAEELGAAGVTVVSGAAVGIDAAAHWGAVNAGGRTIGVLGCGLDVIYPRRNQGLLEKIPAFGALISEFPLGTEPQAGQFPVRNRVIAGLSLAVVVVEADERSGALITARQALEENRDVFAVPGQAGATKSRGTHALLKQGARLVENGRDIIEEIAPQLGLPGQRSQPVRPPQPAMNAEEQGIYVALEDGPLHIDVLSRKTGLPPAQIAAALLHMELRGLIKQLPGTRYMRNG
jgi:DNA processing protein